MKKRRRFTPEFKVQVILEVLTVAQSPAEACRKQALSPDLLTGWKTTILQRLYTLFQGDERRNAATQRLTKKGSTLRKSATSWVEYPFRTRCTASQRRCSNSMGEPLGLMNPRIRDRQRCVHCFPEKL